MFRGIHLIIDYYQVDSQRLDDIDFVIHSLCDAINSAKFNLIKIVSEKYEPHGLSIIALLKESHVSIHTYPENNSMFIDIFTCGEGIPEAISELLYKSFSPQRVEITKIIRGNA
jgi:S-adenosylmethionine decarboxylase proenzyme